MPKRKPAWMSDAQWKNEKPSYFSGKYSKKTKTGRARRSAKGL